MGESEVLPQYIERDVLLCPYRYLEDN